MTPSITTGRASRFGALLFGALLTAPTYAQAQSGALAQRIASAPAGNVQFAYTARDGVCGDGRTWFTTGNGSWYSSGSSSMNVNVNSAMTRPDCAVGPVRVVLVRVDREIVDVTVQAGPLTPEERAHDLGVVPARDASTYLLSLAARLDGKPGRASLLPAMLADSTRAASALLAIARDQDRPRDTRRSAMTWLSREAVESGEASQAVQALSGIARDVDEQRPIRTSAIGALPRLDAGDGVRELVRMADDSADPWLASQAVDALGRTGDPRAREALRRVVTRSEAPDEVRAAAIRGLMQSYATTADAEFLRSRFTALTGPKSRDAVITALAGMGGKPNAEWLMTVARDASVPTTLRRKAISVSERAGVSATDLVALYDRVEERDLRDATVAALAAGGTRAGTDKLLDIAKRDTDVQIRRRAVNHLSRNEDPRVQAALKEIVVR